MTKKLILPKKGEVVIVTEGAEIGRTGVLAKWTRNKSLQDPDVTIEMALIGPKEGDTELRPFSVRKSHVVALHQISIARRQELYAKRAELLSEQDAKRNAWIAEQRAKAIRTYVEKRELHATRPGGMEETYEIGDGLGSRYYSADPLERRTAHQHFSDRITIYARRKSILGGLPEVEINWSALGSATPEEALRFAEGLTRAAHLALGKRAELEAEESDLMVALHAAGLSR